MRPDFIEEKHDAKICTKCKQEKPLEEFRKSNKGLQGRQQRCKKCMKEQGRENYQKNKKEILLKIKRYGEENPEKVREWKQKYINNNLEKVRESKCEHYKKNKDHYKIYRTENLERRRESNKEWAQKNPEKVKESRAKWLKNKPELQKQSNLKWHNNKRANDIGFKLRCVLRSRLHSALKGAAKMSSIKELVGCSFVELKSYLEGKFKEGMTWNNWRYDGWHVDHIKPCALFDLTDPSQQKECFHYTNLQPLWAEENFKKSDSYCKNDLHVR